ncbi:hypothetical protein AgCh_023497 [Apium graveolens]
MSYLATFSLIILSTLLITTNAVNFQARNNFPYVVWADASPGGGPQLNPNDESSLDVAPGTKFARTWGRTNCKFGASGCETEDWNMQLECTGNNGKARNRVAEYANGSAGAVLNGGYALVEYENRSGGGGRRLNPKDQWSVNTPPGTARARIWGRTKRYSDGSRCQT